MRALRTQISRDAIDFNGNHMFVYEVDEISFNEIADQAMALDEVENFIFKLLTIVVALLKQLYSIIVQLKCY